MNLNADNQTATINGKQTPYSDLIALDLADAHSEPVPVIDIEYELENINHQKALINGELIKVFNKEADLLSQLDKLNKKYESINQMELSE